MDNLNDLKAIWLTAKTDSLPKPNEMLRLIKKFRNQKLYKKLALIIIALLLAATMVLVVLIYKSTLWSTRAGEVMMILAALFLVYTNAKSIGRFYRLQDCSNKEFLQFLEQTRQNQISYYKKTQAIAMIFCSAGLLLYLYEAVYKNTLLFVIAYGLTLLYLAVMWFVVRPRVFNKGAKKLNELKERLINISKQL